MKKRLVILFLVMCFFNISLFAFSGKVIRVSDGDTITVLEVVDKEYKQQKIRLYGIDCPEKKQAFGGKAKEFTNKAVYGKIVKVVVKDKDKYRRLVGLVYYDEDKCLNEELLKAGFAWVYTYHYKNSTWEAYEKKAHEEKLGLWADKNFIPPWDWRKINKRKGKL